jgi:hypothetical protein
MPKHGDLGVTRYGFAEELQCFRAKSGQIEEDARDVAAGTSETRSPPVGDGIGFQVHRYDRNG